MLAGCAVLTATVASPQVASGAQAGEAGSTIQLTLDEAGRRAVANNPDLAIVRLGTGAARA
jgi:hypothetical protein